jgi:hypothetical protein
MKVLTILGTSASLYKDIESCGVVGDVMAINHSIKDYAGDIKYAVCLHNDLLQDFMCSRKDSGFNTENVELFDSDCAYADKVNTSGLYALVLSQVLDYDEVRVLGISADNSGHYYADDAEASDNYESKFPFDNEEWIPIFKSWDNVKVASGNLLRLFPKITINNEVITDV